MTTNSKMPSPFRISFRVILLLIMIFLILSSCQSKKEPDVITINPLNAVEGEVRLSEFTDDITYIPLDNKILFQHPNRIEVTKDHFIMATFPTGIMVFDRKGTFRNKIGAMGRGPGEYQFGLHFTIDPENELVYIYDRPKIISYTFSGELVREFSIHDFDGYFWGIYYSNGKLFLAGALLYGRPTYDWLILDTLGNLYSKKYSSVQEFKTKYPGRSGFLTQRNRIYYWNNFNDTIFLLQNETHQPGMYFENLQPFVDFPMDDMGKYFDPQIVINSDNYLFLTYFHEKLRNFAVFKLSNQELINYAKQPISSIRGPGLINDIDGGPNFSPEHCFREDGREYLISWINAFELITHIESEAFRNSTPKFPEKKKELEKLAASLDENDNPVLMLVKLKK
jgi:hypothetical protein